MKNNEEPSPAAERAAERHEEKTQHHTTDFIDDDGVTVLGKICYNCDWIRYNVQPRLTIGEVELKSSPEGEGFSPTPRTGQ